MSGTPGSQRGFRSTYDADGGSSIGEPNLYAVPRDYASGSRPGLIFCHAAQESAAPWLVPANQPSTIAIGTTAGSNAITSVGLFGAPSDGVAIQGDGIPPGTHIIGHTDSSHATMGATVGGVVVAVNATKTYITGSLTVTLGGKYVQMFRSIVDAGFPVISTYMGGDLWGNDTAVAHIEDARSFLVGTLGATSPVLMVGTSMGGLSVYSYMRAHPANVRGAVLVCPVSDLTDTGIQGAFSASINAAYGGAYSDAVYGATHNPIQFCSLLEDTPMQLWVADDDPTARPFPSVQTIQAFHSAEVHHMLGGHNNLNDMDTDLVVAWLLAHAA